MKRAPLLATLAATVAMPAFAQETVSEVDVFFQADAIDSPAAARFWGELEGDLESAILELVANRTSDTGTEIEIDISELDLSQSMMDGMSADAVLVGDVDFATQVESDDDDQSLESETQLSYRLRVVAGEAATNGVSEPVIYRQMVDRFAENVASKLQ